jgi:hypothetical protein
MTLIRNGIINNLRGRSSRRMYAVCSVLVGMFIGLSLINLGSNDSFNNVVSSSTTNSFSTDISDLTTKRGVFNGIETVEWCQCKIERKMIFIISFLVSKIYDRNSTVFFDFFSFNYLKLQNIHHYHLKIAKIRISCFVSLSMVDYLMHSSSSLKVSR